MSRRPTRMPLYEVMRPGLRRPPGSAASGPTGDDVRFGGVVRLPVGTALLVAAGVILALVLAYAAGYSRARDAARAELEQALLDQRIDVGDDQRFAAGAATGGGPDLGGGDPGGPAGGDAGRFARGAGDAGGAGPGGTPEDRGEPRGGGTARGGGGAPEDGADRAGGDPGPRARPRADWQRPRFQWQDAYVLDPIATTPGPWYWTLMTTDLAGARRFIDFARARGLETYAVAVNTSRSRYRVYVVPGLQTRSPDHPWHAPMAAAIEAIGREWAREPGSGGEDLGDAYLHRYD